MLSNTFCHIHGIGPKTEQRLWGAGVRCWDDVCESTVGSVVGGWRCSNVLSCTAESVERLARRDARHFHRQLPSNQQWRLFREFRDSVAYVDIETTGLGESGDYITVIGLYDGTNVRHYVHGGNLEEFARDIEDYRLIVTYNGKQFDVPFIRDYLGVPMEHAHVDLRYVLSSLGYKGGLKGCERRLGIDRGELDGVDGCFAVLLWRRYLEKGDRRALETLLAYNSADVVNLQTLMVLAYNMKVEEAGFGDTHALPVPEAFPLPYEPHVPTVQKIQLERFWV